MIQKWVVYLIIKIIIIVGIIVIVNPNIKDEREKLKWKGYIMYYILWREGSNMRVWFISIQDPKKGAGGHMVSM